MQSTTAPTTTDRSNPLAVMQRYELKYLLSGQQADALRRRLAGHMEADQFGKTTIASLYYDTPDRRLVRRSLDKPEFKEKLRLRSYGPATDESPVFLELKRKAGGIVYKRRVRCTLPAAEAFLAGAPAPDADSQIGRELAAFRDRYGALEPACLILYDRTAYFEPGGELRLTVDENPRYRLTDPAMTDFSRCVSLLDPGSAVLELKVQSAMPLWLARLLSEEGIRKTSFSKYGEAWRRETAAARPDKKLTERKTASCLNPFILRPLPRPSFS
jgi:hypothetical protein